MAMIPLWAQDSLLRRACSLGQGFFMFLNLFSGKYMSSLLLFPTCHCLGAKFTREEHQGDT